MDRGGVCGQGWCVSGQGWCVWICVVRCVSGQGWCVSGQGWCVNGQGIGVHISSHSAPT